MSDKPSAAWYLAPIFLGVIGSAIMWYVLKDEDHPDSPKMVKKGWVIGIVLTVIPLIVWIPMMLMIPWDSMDFDQQMQQYMERKMMGMIDQGMTNDPQVQQQMMQQMNTMMNDPELRQQMMQAMMQNPQMMQDMMGNQQMMGMIGQGMTNP